jgi:flagellar basal-body rod protein FlgB
MSLFDATQITLERALAGTALRQEALAGNLANVNTPGYRRRDVSFHDALAGARPVIAEDPAAVMRADGSTVDPDAENAQMARNGLEHEALAAVAKARIAILRSAMGTR